jgi:hypothetical protein
MHVIGEVVPHHIWDLDAAAKWFKRVANQGRAIAIRTLPVVFGDLFLTGTRVELVVLKAARFNGKRVVIPHPKGMGGVGKVRVLVDGEAKPRPIFK